MAELTKEMGILEVVQQYPQTAPVKFINAFTFIFFPLSMHNFF